MSEPHPYMLTEVMLLELLICWREPTPSLPKIAGITEVFLAALGIDGRSGFQCELGFGDTTTLSFQAEQMHSAVAAAYEWAEKNKGPKAVIS